GEREESSGLIGASEAEDSEAKEAAPDAELAKEPAKAEATPIVEAKATASPSEPERAARLPVPSWLWIVVAVGVAGIAFIYAFWNWERLEIFKKLLTSFFPLALLILAVLGSIVFGLATPSEAAAVGAFGGFILAAIYRFVDHARTASSRRG